MAKVTIRVRRDTTANWVANNPVLADGEIAIEKLTGSSLVKIKIGDGTTAWNTLPYSVDMPTIESYATESAVSAVQAADIAKMYRQKNTPYTAGDIVYGALNLAKGFVLYCKTGGTTSASDITTWGAVNADTTDGAVVWTTKNAGDLLPVLYVTANTTLLVSQMPSYVNCTGTVPYTVTMPTPSTANGGTFVVRNANSVAITLATPAGTFLGPHGSATTSLSLPPGVIVELYTGGSNWVVTTWEDNPTTTGTAPITVTTDANNNKTISHAVSGIAAGTYNGLTVTALGHATAFTQPTTLSGYGIADAPTTTAMNTAIAANSFYRIVGDNGNVVNNTKLGVLQVSFKIVSDSNMVSGDTVSLVIQNETTATVSTLLTLTAGTDFTIGTTLTDTVNNIATVLTANTTFNAIYTVVTVSGSLVITEITATGNTPFYITYVHNSTTYFIAQYYQPSIIAGTTYFKITSNSEKIITIPTIFKNYQIKAEIQILIPYNGKSVWINSPQLQSITVNGTTLLTGIEVTVDYTINAIRIKNKQLFSASQSIPSNTFPSSLITGGSGFNWLYTLLARLVITKTGGLV